MSTIQLAVIMIIILTSIILLLNKDNSREGY